MSSSATPSGPLRFVAPSTGAARGAHAKPHRKTLGVLADYMNAAGATYESLLREALDARCRELDCNLVVVYGRALREPNPTSTAHNAIFDLVGPETFDGLIVISAVLAAYAGAEGISQMAQRYRSMPMCSIGVEVAGVPSVITDNRVGMDAVLEHMITGHGCRRLAFVAGTPGNPESRVRLDVYRTVLERHGIAFDPTLVVHGNFVRDQAKTAIEEMLARGTEIDAVMTANDAMAAGAIEALRKGRWRVPRDVAVTGFDDVQFARLANPPLTTVRQPLEAIAETAVRIVLDQMAGRSVPLLCALPTELVVRHSCGCSVREAAAPGGRVRRTERDPADFLREHAEQIRDVLALALTVRSRPGAPNAARLVGALTVELAGGAESFVRVVEDMLDEAAGDAEAGRALQLALIALRRELLEVATMELEELWHEANAAVALATTTGQALHRLAIDGMYYRLVGAGERASMAMDLPSLAEILGKCLPELEIQTAFIALFPQPGSPELEPFLCLLDGVPVIPPAPRFPATLLIPPGFYPVGRRHTSLVLPLVFETQHLGVAAFEHSASINGCNILRDQISAALHNMTIHREMVDKTILHQRSVQERLATAERMQSLSVLAGGVAHDLNNALGPLVALPDVITAEINELQLPELAVQDLRADVESIKTASQRAAQTIKDLLTLGRQGRVAKEPIDLNRLVQSCLGVGTLRFLQNAHHEAKIVVDLESDPSIIQGSEAHVTRAVMNLVRNALEAIQGHGQVVVRTFRTRIVEPTSGYEPVAPGEYAVVTISDDGGGIPAADLGRVFEPFFTKKRAGDHSGTGLGLAVVHGVVKEHDGYIDVMSTEGKGTTFTLYFPLAHEATVTCGRNSSLRPANARVLVVDDDPIQLRTARRILHRLGYQVDTLESGRRACNLFAEAAAAGKKPYDLVILDMLLNEDRDGQQVYEEIRRLFPGQQAIVASGHAPHEHIERVAKSGLIWLGKPYTADALAHAVQRALKRRAGSVLSAKPPAPIVRESLGPGEPPASSRRTTRVPTPDARGTRPSGKC